MGFLEKLTSLLHIEIDVSQLKELKVKLIGDKNNVGLINVVKTEVHVNINAKELADPAVKKQVMGLLRAEVHEESRPVLEANASNIIHEISELSTDKELLTYFEGKIPQSDIPILRACLFIKDLHERGEPVEDYLSDVRYRYGQHGANIANLCSAGYFETYIKPMYEELSTRPNFEAHMFTENYKLVVDTAPFAVFVSRTDSLAQLQTQIIQKIEFNRLYGLRKINIHGIGRENVQKIEELLQMKPLTNLFSNPPTINSPGGVINVTIFY